MTIVNFEKLNQMIRKVEIILDEEELNGIEKELIINKVMLRQRLKEQQTKASDMMGSMPLGGLLKRLTKDAAKTEE